MLNPGYTTISKFLIQQVPEGRQGRELAALLMDVAAVIKDVERPVRLRIGDRNYEEMTTRQILETYLKVKRVPRERAQLLMRYADQLAADLE